MPTFEFTSPEGKTYEVSAPEGATEAQAWQVLQQQQQQQATLDEPTKPTWSGKDWLADEDKKGGALERFGLGVAAPVIQTALGIKDLLGGELTPEQEYALQATKREGGLAKTLGSVAGEIALMAAPASGAAKGGRMLQKAWNAKKAAQLMKGGAGRVSAEAAARSGLSRLPSTALPLAAESLAIGGVDALKAPTEDESRLERGAKTAAMGFGAGAALGAAGNVAKRLMRPKTFRKSKAAMRQQARLRAYGEDDYIPLNLALGKEAGTVGRTTKAIQEKVMTAIPRIGDKLRKQRDDAVKKWVGITFDDAIPKGLDPEWRNLMKPASKEGTTAPVWDAIKDVQTMYRGEYSRLLDKHKFGSALTRAWLKTFTDAMPNAKTGKKVAKNVASLMEDITEKGVITGGAIKSELQKNLRGLATKADKKSNYLERDAYTKLVGELESVLEDRVKRAGGKDLADYKGLAKPYKNFVTIQDAAFRKSAAKDILEPKDVAARAARKKGQAPSIGASGRGPLQKSAAQAEDVYRKLPQTENPFLLLAGTATAMSPMAAGAAMGGAGGALAGAAIPAWMLASTSPKVQRHLMSELPRQKEFAKVLRKYRKSTERLGRGARIGAATGGYVGE